MKVGNYVKLVAFIVVIAVAAASGAPQDRSTIARVAVFALIVTAAVGLMDVARRRSPLPEASVFEPHVERAAAPSLPADLERLGVEVRAFSVPLEAGATQVPGALTPGLPRHRGRATRPPRRPAPRRTVRCRRLRGGMRP